MFDQGQAVTSREFVPIWQFHRDGGGQQPGGLGHLDRKTMQLRTATARRNQRSLQWHTQVIGRVRDRFNPGQIGILGQDNAG